MASSVPSPSINANGVVVPPQTGSGSILEGVLADLNAAFGGNLNTTNLSTPQGQLASSITAYIADKNSLFSYFVSQVDPQYSQGFMQDAIGRLFGITRLPATYTTITCTCSGAAGTVIPANAQAMDTSGNLFVCSGGGSISGSGTVSLVFTAVNPGPVSCPAGTLTRIMTTTSGWDSITNPTGTDTNPLLLGTNVENAQAFELRRQASLYANAQGMTDSVRAAVLSSGSTLNPPLIPTDCLVLDNSGNLTSKGVTLFAGSMYVGVQGGDPTSIGNAIWSKKSMGCTYAPTSSVTASITGGVMTVSAVAFGFLAVGQSIIIGGTPHSATITSLGTGTGGTGTYNISDATLVFSGQLSTSNIITVYDTAYPYPQPSYSVWYTVVQQLPIYVAVSLVNSASVPAGYLATVQAAVESAFLGTDGGQKATIGGTIYGSRFYAPILAAMPNVQIASIEVGTAPSPTGASVTVTGYQYPVTGSAYITVSLV